MANVMSGKVVKAAGEKTVSVLVVSYKNHPVYKKRYVYSKKYLVHDAAGEAGVGDTVVIRQSKPVSRRKRWTLDRVAAKAGASIEPVPATAPETAAAEAAPAAKKKPAAKKAPAKPKTAKPGAAKPAAKAADGEADK